jgi:hypothetical protein
MGSIEGFMSFFAYWAFGQDREEYSSFYRTIWTQFRVFIGDFGLDAKETPDALYFAYLVSYIFLIFILLLNFLLAIIMKAYQAVQQRVKDNQAEKNVIADVVDIAHTCWRARREGWPSSMQLLKYLSGGPRSELAQLPAVTAEELFAHLQDSSGQPVFASLESAENYINFYSTKVTEAGKHTQLESRRSHRLKPGRSFGDGLAEEGWLETRSNPDSDRTDDEVESANLAPRFKARRKWSSRHSKSQMTALAEPVQDVELGINATKVDTLDAGPRLLGGTASSKRCTQMSL